MYPLKFTVQWFLEYSQNCAPVTTNYRIFHPLHFTCSLSSDGCPDHFQLLSITNNVGINIFVCDCLMSFSGCACIKTRSRTFR